MKKIKLTRGKFALVDDEDFEFLNQWKWCLRNSGRYAGRCDYKNNKWILMHRVINNTPVGMETDHINRNKLDNRRSNLRSVTGCQNMMNVGVPSNNVSGYRGVSWDNKHKKWMAQIVVEWKSIWLGRHSRLEDAISARKQGESIYHAT